MASGLDAIIESPLSIISGIIVLWVDYMIQDAFLEGVGGLLPGALTLLLGVVGAILLVLGIANLFGVNARG